METAKRSVMMIWWQIVIFSLGGGLIAGAITELGIKLGVRLNIGLISIIVPVLVVGMILYISYITGVKPSVGLAAGLGIEIGFWLGVALIVGLGICLNALNIVVGYNTILTMAGITKMIFSWKGVICGVLFFGMGISFGYLIISIGSL